MFAAVGASVVMTSPDGTTWTSRTPAANNDWRSIAWNGTVFSAGGTSGSGNRIMTSPDGITWTSRTSAKDSWWPAMAWNGLGTGTTLLLPTAGAGSVFAAVSASGTSGLLVMTCHFNKGGGS